jgi:hypothetical protein
MYVGMGIDFVGRGNEKGMDCAGRGNRNGRTRNGNGRTRNDSLPLTALISSRDCNDIVISHTSSLQVCNTVTQYA